MPADQLRRQEETRPPLDARPLDGVIAVRGPDAVGALEDPQVDPAAAGAPPPISLTHKAFKLKVRGEYADLVKAMAEIQGLPKAISINQYDLQLLEKKAEAAAAPQPDKDGHVESPTALEMGFQVSITFLMAGGTPPQPATPAPGTIGVIAPTTGLDAFVTWLLGGEARAVEQVGAVPHALPSLPAAGATKYRLTGLSLQNGQLKLATTGGTPPYTLVGLTRTKAVLELANTAIAPGAEIEAQGPGTIRMARAASDKPGVVRIVVETDGSARLKAALDGYERLHVVTAPWQEPARATAPAQPKRTAAQAPAKSAASRTRVQDVKFENGELVVYTSGPAPRFEMLGGTKTRLVIELDNTVITAPGKVFPVKAAGIEQVRVVLYKNNPVTTRVVVDTNGTVKLDPYQGADGRLRVRMAASGAPAAAAKASKPVKAAAVAPNTPKATPTPMAVPGQAAKVPAKPKPKASSFPESDMKGADGPHLQRSLTSSYAFPIERERTTGRANPFKVLPSRNQPKPAAETPGALPVGQPPVLPVPGGLSAPPALPGAPGAPAATAKTYALSAVIMGGGQPPVAAIQVDGKTHMVGLNDTLPGNARVKSIQGDHVVLAAGNQELRIGLKK